MEARAQARYIRVTPMKARRVVDLIRGLPAAEAQAILRYVPQAATEPVGKVLKSAIANAEHNYGMDMDRLVVVKAYADQGPSMKRWQPVSMGRVHPYKHRTSHITVVVAER